MLLTRFRSFFFWLWVNHFCLICVHLLLVYHSAQLSRTWSYFSRLLRVMISETRILFISFWFYFHRLWWSSWHAMLALFPLYLFLVWIFSWRDLFQVTGTDALTLGSAYCAWYVAFLGSTYTSLLRASPYLFLVHLNSLV